MVQLIRVPLAVYRSDEHDVVDPAPPFVIREIAFSFPIS
jgi:hypothetical protein